ncbi:MAG: hypothetical protein HUJ53_00180, partial [Holdemanella sp.]|nr:hypothetical protein [Holdemanella sp.]
DGNYQDSTSQRAKATVKSTETGANIVIEWANDANSLTTWTMDVKQSEDGLLSFKNCTKTVDGKVEYTDKDGFFNYVDGKLIWNGAVDTECQECIFIKI